MININTLEISPIVEGRTYAGRKGLRFAFAVGDMTEIQLHFATTIQDREGSGKNLTQYSYVSLWDDAINCLKENGRLPAVL